VQSVREAAERFQRIAESRKLTKILNRQNEDGMGEREAGILTFASGAP
jgi:hypothetical protein